MGKRVKAFCTFVRSDFGQLFHSAKLYIVLAAAFVGLFTCFGGMRPYLQWSGSTVNPLELFTICVSNRVPLWIVYIGMVVLLADIPFRRKGDIQSVLRANRRSWLTSQLAFSVLSIFLYLAFILLFFFALTAGHWSFPPSWSSSVRQAASEGSDSIGSVFGIAFWQELLRGSPYLFFLKAFWLSVLSGLFISALLTLFHLFGKPKLGHVLCAVFPMLDYLLIDAFDFPWFQNVAKYLSPFSLTNLAFLQPINGDGKTLVFSSIYLGICTLFVVILAYWQVKRYDYYTA